MLTYATIQIKPTVFSIVAVILFLAVLSSTASAAYIIPDNVTSTNESIVPGAYMNDSNLSTGGKIAGYDSDVGAQTINVTSNFSGIVGSNVTIMTHAQKSSFYGGTLKLYLYNYINSTFDLISSSVVTSIGKNWYNRSCTFISSMHETFLYNLCWYKEANI